MVADIAVFVEDKTEILIFFFSIFFYEFSSLCLSSFCLILFYLKTKIKIKKADGRKRMDLNLNH